MNPDTPQNPREQLEMRLTALLLGELSQEEATALREVIAKDPQLAALEERLKQTIELIRETAMSPAEETAAQPAPPKLSTARREKLLAQFKTITPKEFAKPSGFKLKWLIPMSATAALLLLIGTMTYNLFRPTHRAFSVGADSENLRLTKRMAPVAEAKQSGTTEAASLPPATPSIRFGTWATTPATPAPAPATAPSGGPIVTFANAVTAPAMTPPPVAAPTPVAAPGVMVAPTIVGTAQLEPPARATIVLPTTTDATELAVNPAVVPALGIDTGFAYNDSTRGRQSGQAQNNRFYTSLTQDDVGGLRDMYRLTDSQGSGGAGGSGAHAGEKPNMVMTAESSHSLDFYAPAGGANMNPVLVRGGQAQSGADARTSGDALALSGGTTFGVGNLNVPTYEFKQAEGLRFTPQDKLTAEAKKIDDANKPANSRIDSFGNAVTVQNGGNTYVRGLANEAEAPKNLGEQFRVGGVGAGNGFGGGRGGGGGSGADGAFGAVNGISTNSMAANRAPAIAGVGNGIRFVTGTSEAESISRAIAEQNRGLKTDLADGAQIDGVTQNKVTGRQAADAPQINVKAKFAEIGKREEAKASDQKSLAALAEQTVKGNVNQGDSFEFRESNGGKLGDIPGLGWAFRGGSNANGQSTAVKGVNWTGTLQQKSYSSGNIGGNVEVAKQQPQAQTPTSGVISAKIGDPDWIGALDQPDQRRNSSNQFIARYNWFDTSSEKPKEVPAVPRAMPTTVTTLGVAVADTASADALGRQTMLQSPKAGAGTQPAPNLTHRYSFNAPLTDANGQPAEKPVIIDGNDKPTLGDREVTGTYFGSINAEAQRRIESQSMLAGGKVVEAEHEKAGKDVALQSDSDPRMQANALYLQSTNGVLNGDLLSRGTHVVTLNYAQPTDVNQVVVDLYTNSQQPGLNQKRETADVARGDNATANPTGLFPGTFFPISPDGSSTTGRWLERSLDGTIGGIGGNISSQVKLPNKEEVSVDWMTRTADGKAQISISQFGERKTEGGKLEPDFKFKVLTVDASDAKKIAQLADARSPEAGKALGELMARAGASNFDALPNAGGTVTKRDYPNSTQPGPVQATYDPDTGKFIVITDDKTFESANQVLSVIDKAEVNRLLASGELKSAQAAAKVPETPKEIPKELASPKADSPRNLNLQLSSRPVTPKPNATAGRGAVTTAAEDTVKTAVSREAVYQSVQDTLSRARADALAGNYAAADEKLSGLKVIDPENSDVLAAYNQNKLKLDAQKGFRPNAEVVAKAPTYRSNSVAVAEQVQNGRFFLEMGDLDNAEASLKQALTKEPDNTAALHYLELAAERRSANSDIRGQVAARKALVQVESDWDLEQRTRQTTPKPNASASRETVSTGKGREEIMSKLKSIKVDSIDFKDVTLREALNKLADVARSRDPQGLGINFFVDPLQQYGNLDANGVPIPGSTDLAESKIHMSLRNVSLADVVNALTKTSDTPLAYNIKEYAVEFSPKNTPSAQQQIKPATPVQTDPVVRKPATPPPIPQPEVLARENAFSTFSLNVSDVSFKLAGASLEKGTLPEPGAVRAEEFINAFDYRDPEPGPGTAIGFASERAHYPFAQNRDLLRFSVKTAAAGRQANRPLNLVILLDNSGSMERADRVQIIHEALRVLASQLKPQDRVSVITFSRLARLWVDGIAGNQAGDVLDHVGSLTPEGGTNLEEAMKLAYATALRHYLGNGLNRVVMLTDGAANLGNVDPASLKQMVETQRKQGIALDCFGVGWEGFNDDLLEELSRNGDGRYGFINSPEEASTEFAAQLAGALQVAASDVKVQVEFNPQRVSSYRQIGYAKHQLTKEQFRDNTVDAAEIGAAESGNALYTVETNPAGEGPVATVRVRYRDPGTQSFYEKEWVVPYNGPAVAMDQGSAAMRLAATSAAFAEWLAQSPFASEVSPDRLLGILNGVPEIYGADVRPKKLETMIREAKSLSGQ